MDTFKEKPTRSVPPINYRAASGIRPRKPARYEDRDPNSELENEGPPNRRPCPYPLFNYVTQGLEFFCRYCDLRFASGTDRTIHTGLAHPEKIGFNCQICKRLCPSNELLIAHINQFHANKEKKKNKCKECGEEFQSLTELTSHALLHDDDDDEEVGEGEGEDMVETKTKNTLDPVCEVCGKCFQNKAQLVYHETIHKIDRVYKCPNPDCARSRGYKYRYHLVNHLTRAHSLSERKVNRWFKFPELVDLFDGEDDVPSPESENHNEEDDMGIGEPSGNNDEGTVEEVNVEVNYLAKAGIRLKKQKKKRKRERTDEDDDPDFVQ